MQNATSLKETGDFEFYGLLIKQGFTTYQYGTHIISNDIQSYALQSKTLNLDTFVNKHVSIKGKKIEGYPLEDGPDFIDVKVVQ